jgi:hypothetical protein
MLMDLPLDDGTISDFKIVFSTRRLHAADHYRALHLLLRIEAAQAAEAAETNTSSVDLVA